MTKRRLKITPVLMALNVLVLVLIVLFYGFRMIKYYLKENGSSNKDTTNYLVDSVLKKQSFVDLTKGLIYDEENKEYRYVGEVNDNYIEYSGITYRIIGIDKDNNVRMVADKSVTLMYSGLEKGYDNSYVNKWLNKNEELKYSGVFESNINESVNYLMNSYICEDEIDDVKNITCKKSNNNNKIVLLSLYDYYKAGGKSSFLNNKETFYLGTVNSEKHNYYITNDGEVSINELSTKAYGVRPVISINSGTVLISGKGTKDEPYKIYNNEPSTLEEASINSYVCFSDQVFKIVDNSRSATKVALDGTLKDVNVAFGGKDNVYTSKKGVGSYLNTKYLKTLDKNMMVNAIWYTGKLSLDNLDYASERDIYATMYVGMMGLADLFNNEEVNTLTLSRGIESDQIINVINKEGMVYGDFIDNKYNVRPVLFLKKNLKITGGKGTKDDAYTLGASDEKGK